MAPETSDRTLRHYESNAEGFWEGTRDHDVSQNIDALLGALGKRAPLRILDFGCGPGRDLRTFSLRGHSAVGVDGCASFVRMARAHSGCEVWRQDFLSLSLPHAHFDGVFANASLFHIPSVELGRVLGELRDALKPAGVLLCSNPRGDGQEGWVDGRYGSFFDIDGWRRLFAAAGFVELGHYYRPMGCARENQPWLVMLWRAP